MDVVDIIHGAMFIATVIGYVTLNVSGHTTPTDNQAMMGLASFVAGSYVRGKTGGGQS